MEVVELARVCPRCKVDRRKSEYPPKVWDRTQKGGYHCNPCRSKQNYLWKLKTRYGITVEEHKQMFEKQKGLCALCNKPQPTQRQFMVDHDHETGRVRGLLCAKCNSALGVLGDNEAGLLKALKYLRGE